MDDFRAGCADGKLSTRQGASAQPLAQNLFSMVEFGMMYTLRPVTDADYEFIYTLNSSTMRPYVEPIWGWDEDVQRSAFARRWNPDNQQIIIVEARNAGRLTLNETDELLYIAQINLLPEFQGKGIGSAVIESVKADATRAGKFVELRVLKTNPSARRLYERLGFTVFDESDTHFWMRWK